MNHINFLNKNSIRYILLLLSFSVLFLILAISFTKFWWGDDYSFKMLIDEHDNLLSFLKYRYFNKEGRVLSLGGFIQAFQIKYFPAWLSVFNWSLCFVLSAAFINRILIRKIKLKLSLSYELVLWAVTSTLLFQGFRNHIAETVYWSVGGYYIFNLLIFVVWSYILLFIKIQKPIVNWLYFILSFIVGLGTQNMSIAALGLLILIFLIERIYPSSDFDVKVKYGAILFFLLLGMIVISLSPGNFIRASHVDNAFFHGNYLSFFLKTLGSYLYWSKVVVLGSMLMGFLLFIFKLNSKPPKDLLISSFKWFILSLSTIIPFAILGGFVSPRTSIYFQVILFLGITELSIYLLLLVFKSFSISAFKEFAKSVAVITVFIILSFQFINSYKQYMNGRSLNAKKILREKYIRNQIKEENKDILLDPIEPKPSKTTFAILFRDIETDPSNYKNQYLVRYYHLNSIRLKNSK